jgi:cation transport ATPase
MRQTDDSHLDHPGKEGHADEHKAGFAEYLRLALMALVIVASLTGWWRHWMSRDWLAFAATLIGGFPIYQEAWENLRKRRMTMELSMTLALVAALCIGQFLTALVIAFFVLFGWQWAACDPNLDRRPAASGESAAWRRGT